MRRRIDGANEPRAEPASLAEPGTIIKPGSAAPPTEPGSVAPLPDGRVASEREVLEFLAEQFRTGKVFAFPRVKNRNPQTPEPPAYSDPCIPVIDTDHDRCKGSASVFFIKLFRGKDLSVPVRICLTV